MTTLQIIAIVSTVIYALIFWIFGSEIFGFNDRKQLKKIKKRIKELEDEQVDH